MLKKIALGIVFVVIVFCIVVAMRPADFQVERQITITSPASVIFTKINDFHAWKDWSPWEKLDPNMKKTYSTQVVGVGSTYAWEGNKDVGKGQMTITESIANEKIAIKLEFFEPWTATNSTTFVIAPSTGGGSTVTWKMAGHHNFFGKVFSIFMDMDKMVGKDFEKGLQALKEQAEKLSAVG